MDLITRTNGNWIPSLLEDIFDDHTIKNKFTSMRSLPAVNIQENEDTYLLELAAPGKTKEDFDIELDNELLTISSETKKEQKAENENGQFSRREFNYESFKRSFTLPETVDFSKIKANYENGILKIELPKREEAKKQPKRLIEIG